MTNGVCITCGDQALPGRVVALLEDGLARVDVAGVGEEVSVELIGAAVGDLVLVHAKVAIGRLHEGS
jgi:hydrogenase expression/formation protein HypC